VWSQNFIESALLLLSGCMSRLLRANEDSHKSRYGDDEVAAAAEEGGTVTFIKSHANIQTPCEFRTRSQLVLVLERDAR
jgi:hypothetical protein